MMLESYVIYLCKNRLSFTSLWSADYLYHISSLDALPNELFIISFSRKRSPHRDNDKNLLMYKDIISKKDERKWWKGTC